MSSNHNVPSPREFTLVGVVYGTFVLGLFLVWPAVIGVVLAYARKSHAAGSVLASHYRWLIRTFWWSFVWGTLVLAGMLWVIVPNAVEIAQATRSGEYLSIPWSLLGSALGGLMALSIVWCWNLYRIVRGLLRLSDGEPAPGGSPAS